MSTSGFRLDSVIKHRANLSERSSSIFDLHKRGEQVSPASTLGLLASAILNSKIFRRANSEGCPANPKTQIIISESTRVSAPNSDSNGVLGVKPTATTKHQERTTAIVRIRLLGIGILRIPVRAKLPYISRHIIESEFVGGFCTDLVRSAVVFRNSFQAIFAAKRAFKKLISRIV